MNQANNVLLENIQQSEPQMARQSDFERDFDFSLEEAEELQSLEVDDSDGFL
ncbi:hypothetical protein IQ272_27015, partial [Chroococcidiopsidales cyanobacterium LEGE 13417]|nr:hypothetical protein [Chroococcidiopsidales cyanobacterium LEGE 13417]